MNNLDRALACIELRSISFGYKVLAQILESPETKVRVLEATPCGTGFMILALGEPEALKLCLDRARSGSAAERDLWRDGEIIEIGSREIAESFFALTSEAPQEAIVVIETETVAGALACAHTLVEGHGLKSIEIRVMRSSNGGAYGFFTGSRDLCLAGAGQSRARLAQDRRNGRIETIDMGSPRFRSYFDVKGTR